MATLTTDRRFASLEEALTGLDIPPAFSEPLALLEIPLINFVDEEVIGQMVVHQAVAEDVMHCFAELHAQRFPIARMVPVAAYGWDDDASMAANNSSAFNYRVIAGTDRLSNHAKGLALDLNPVQNPFISRSGLILPRGATYDLRARGTITPEIADIFLRRGWIWGGNWKDPIDYQHFEKVV